VTDTNQASATGDPAQPGRPKGKLSYLPEFDGFRGIGIMFVILAHLSPLMPGPDFWGSYLLVDLFFVISGYLITNLLLREFDTYGRVSLKNFYVRRGLRLLPAIFISIILCGIIVAAVRPDLPRPFGQIVFIVLAYFGNWINPSTLGPFTPTWSLALEEQYYIVWPILLLVLLRLRIFRSRRALAVTMFAGALGVALLRYLVFAYTSRRSIAYYSTLTRADGVILGSALALFLPTIKQRTRELLAHPITGWIAAGGLGIAYMTTQTGEDVLFKGPLLVVNLLGTLLVAYLVERRDGWLNRTLSIPAFTFTGRLSYAMYLYHTPIILLMYHGTIPTFWNGLGNALIAIVVTYAIGTASYLFVEAPALKLKGRFGTMSRMSKSDSVELATHPEESIRDEPLPTASDEPPRPPSDEPSPQTSGSDGTS
jgi:peptidoglycan/LPS O-acetylase OafA/YrhL